MTNAYGQVTAETDPTGAKTYYSFDQFGSLDSSTNQYGATTYMNYYLNTDNPNDPYNGDLLSTTNPLGSSTSFGYDSAGDVTSTTTPAGTTVNTFDQYGDLLTTTSPQGVTTTNTYDNNGHELTSQWVWTNPSPPTTRNGRHDLHV